MAAGRIINRALLQVVSRFLNIEGIEQFPAKLDLSDIKAVIDIGRFANPLATVTPPEVGTPAFMGGSVTLGAGWSLYFINLIAAAPFNVLDPVPITGGLAARVDCIDFEITFTNAAAVAMANRSMFLNLVFQDLAGDPPNEQRIITLMPWITPGGAGNLIYRWALDGFSSGINASTVTTTTGAGTWNKRFDNFNALPTNVLQLQFGMSDGTAGPAGVSFRVSCRARQSTNGIPPNA